MLVVVGKKIYVEKFLELFSGGKLAGIVLLLFKLFPFFASLAHIW